MSPNVYLKRSAKWHLAMALMVILTFSTICAAEFDNKANLLEQPRNLEPHGLPIKVTDMNGVQKKSVDVDLNLDLQRAIKRKGNFFDAFTAAFSFILLTELGDKTFFIAAIMALRHPRLVIFGGAITALALMTILSCLFGMAANFFPMIYTYYISTALFLIFGLLILNDGLKMKPTAAQENLEEVQSNVRKRETELDRDFNAAQVQDQEKGRRPKKRHRVSVFTMRIFAQAFTMTFLAEWGDRSQLTTIILAASKDVYGVIVGGILGHCICTGVAVIGGRLVASRISVRTVTVLGGIVFVAFAVFAVLLPPDDL
ncbi:transmembrane protein 165-like [Drosophila innubila]|uniref:transmembrane protein 165-like n=1 Tax=Drosophila innubila TaxID=198719 RepID=UPI00148BA862|nr:transmembrane protein 165-like [Drosophila innubila]